MIGFPVVVIAFAAGISTSAASAIKTKMYFVGPQIGASNNQLAVVPAICFLDKRFCPPGYNGAAGGGAKPPAGAPQDLNTQIQAALSNGNSYRSRHGAPALTNDAALQADAQRYAEELARTQTFQHSNPGNPAAYGENLAMLPTGASSSIAAANDAWYNTEKNLYCPAGGPVNAASGHFRQLIWKGSTKVGYGSAVGANGYTYVVARYSPPGNYQGLEASNLQC